MRYRPQLWGNPPMGIFCGQRWFWNQFGWPDLKLVGFRLKSNNKNNVNSFFIPLFENKSSVPSHTIVFIVIAVAHVRWTMSRLSNPHYAGVEDWEGGITAIVFRVYKRELKWPISSSKKKKKGSWLLDSVASHFQLSFLFFLELRTGIAVYADVGCKDEGKL